MLPEEMKLKKRMSSLISLSINYGMSKYNGRK